MWKDAYDAFEQKMPPSDMGGTDLKDIPEKRRKRREGGGPFSQKKHTKNASIFIDSINHQTSVDNRQCGVTIMIIIIIIIITTINLYVYV